MIDDGSRSRAEEKWAKLLLCVGVRLYVASISTSDGLL